MAPRAFWTGNLRLSLVNIPVRLYPATNTERKIELHQIHEPSGKRIRYQKVAPGVGAVENEDIIKGYEYEKGKYVLLDQKEIDELKLESKPRAMHNLFAPLMPPEVDTEAIAAMQAVLAPFRAELGLPEAPLPLLYIRGVDRLIKARP